MSGRSFRDRVEKAAENSSKRRLALAAWTGRFESGGFDWVVPPVLNPFTRIAVEMCPAKGVLRALGYESSPDADFPEPVTQPCQVSVIRPQ